MSLYQILAQGLNPGAGAVDAAKINLQGQKMAHEIESEKQRQAVAAEDRQNDIKQQAFENKLKIQKLMDNVDKDKREQFRKQMEDFVKVADWIESQPDKQAAYEQALQQLKSQHPDLKFPEKYDSQQTAILKAIVQPTDKLFESGSYGRPIEGQDSEGNPAFFQANKSGEVKKVEDYVPLLELLGKRKPLTPNQLAGNLTTDIARRALKSRNLSQEQIKAATQQYTDTGRSNPAYDPQLSSILREALSRKVGDDPEFEELYLQFYGKPPEDTQSVESTVETEQPPVQGARKAPDGNWYVEDPDRPGKYLQVVQ
ncbi:MAG: hypothetical protein JAY74_18690 [Candidatus Thiodiazotropha taylori]|nr:hypothetical protein [Candidatus Thiodiazotropha taylori]